MHLQNMFDGRMAAGAFHDNLVAPYQGVAGSDMSDVQRTVLLSLAATYVGWQGDAHAEVKLTEVAAHLDETWFSWYGGYDDVAPFYYRVHSPVILIEFDHHPGVAFDNEEPTRNHVHTVVRTPQRRRLRRRSPPRALRTLIPPLTSQPAVYRPDGGCAVRSRV